MSTPGANRLARETSPYLKQHAGNPVDWYPWGEEALQRSRAEDKPIFLSIGYSACHWCHVMEKESFEDPRIAGLMNERFVNIKVDREERPDLDDIYMVATQLLAGQGGWPNSVFLTPALEPFFAGTYFPPSSRWGRPGFAEVLTAVAAAYRDKRGDVGRVGGEVAAQIRRLSELQTTADVLGPSILNRAFGEMAGRFDNAAGGFGGAPKFPPSAGIAFLLRYHRRTGNPEALRMAALTLDAMARGGLRDQIGGGFHRYSVDARWLVPHFEKMLYDNALLARVYVEASQAVAAIPAAPALPGGGSEAAARYREVARDTLDWVLRDMTSPEGAFYASLDADSEGEEGKFYVWTPAEIESVLGRQEAALWNGVYGVTPQGNFEGGTSILHLERPLREVAASLAIDLPELRLRLAGARARLLKARAARPGPARDDKILADWNGLMIAALASAGRVLDDAGYREAAARAARFVLDRMRDGGTLRHTWQEGRPRHPAHLPDYAAMIEALLELYAGTFDPSWIGEARALAAVMIDRFGDSGEGFHFTARDREPLIARTRESGDGATPAGVSMAALALPRLAWLAGDDALAKVSAATLRLYGGSLERHPAGWTALLCAVDRHLDRQRQIVIAGEAGDPGVRAWIDALRGRYDPNTVIALADPSDARAARTIPLLEGKVPVNGKPAAYVCENGTCAAPIVAPEPIPD